MQQRYYDSLAGRFLSVDPVTTSAKDGSFFGRYHYAASNPYKFKDPDGRAFETAWDLASFALSVGQFMQSPSLGNALGAAIDAAAVALPGIPGGVGALRAADKAADAAKNSTVVIGRKEALEKSDALKPGERKLGWEQKSDSKSNWKENSRQLREAMAEGKPIRDASPGDKDGAYLSAERNLLENKGWSFDSKTNHWMPPKE